MSAKNRQISQFHIAFDTNALYTDVGDRLISDALSKFIIDKNKNGKPKITWYLLEIVRAERYHQMLLAVPKFISQLERIEKLLGKKFGIAEKDIEKGLNEVIDREAKNHTLHLRKLDTSQVDWSWIIDRSTSRKPPFEEGPKEKGFRDSIVLETFLQLVDSLHRDDSQQFVLMTNDGRLKDAVGDRVKAKEHILTVDDLPALESMLNAYLSQIGEAEIDEILKKAQMLFFQDSASGGLLRQWEIEEKIRKNPILRGNLLALPGGRGAETAVIAAISSVGPTTFVEKTNGDFTFATRLTFRRTAAIPTSNNLQFGASPFRSNTAPYGVGTSMGNTANFGIGLGGTLPSEGVANTSFGIGGSVEPSGVSNPLYPTFGAGSFGRTENLLFPSGGALVSGVVPGELPRFIYTFGEAVFEIKWKAAVTEARELDKAALIGTRFYSSAWYL